MVFLQKIRENPGQFIRHDIIDKVLLRDLPSLYGITDVQELNSVFTMIAYHSGGQFSYETLAKESGELVSLRYFMEKNNMQDVIVTTRTQQGTKVMDWGRKHYIPVAWDAYTVGENTLKQTKDNCGL